MNDYHGRFDLNKDRNVTRDELVATFTEANVKDAEAEADKFLEMWGTGEDVSNLWGFWGRSHWQRHIEINNYLQMIRATGIIPGKHLAVDTNKDGVISQEEVVNMYGQEIYDQLA